MREIKFRKWDNVWEIMSLEEKYIPEHYGPNEYIMQYTGLKDKNGVEVYEGDIVYDKMNDKYGDIKYNDKMGRWSIYWSNWSRMNEFHGEAMDSWVYPTMSIQVKGNIYEDPHLLN